LSWEFSFGFGVACGWIRSVDGSMSASFSHVRAINEKRTTDGDTVTRQKSPTGRLFAYNNNNSKKFLFVKLLKISSLVYEEKIKQN
jgi:hypothetical protein